MGKYSFSIFLLIMFLLVIQNSEANNINTFMTNDGIYSGAYGMNFNLNGNLMVYWTGSYPNRSLGVYDNEGNRLSLKSLGNYDVFGIIQTHNSYYWTAGNSYLVNAFSSMDDSSITISTAYQDPMGLDYAQDGNTYGVFHSFNGSPGGSGIFQINANDNVSTYAQLSISSVADVAIDSNMNFFISDYISDKIWKYNEVDGLSIFADSSDGLADPFGLDFDKYGNLYVTNRSSNSESIIGYNVNGVQIFYAGRSDGISDPRALKFDNEGNLFFTDSDEGVKYIIAGDLPIPIPGAVWLLGSGLIALVGLRRKFKK
jgi:hypothetical protein